MPGQAFFVPYETRSTKMCCQNKFVFHLVFENEISRRLIDFAGNTQFEALDQNAMSF